MPAILLPVSAGLMHQSVEYNVGGALRPEDSAPPYWLLKGCLPMRRFLPSRPHMLFLISACTLCVILACAGVVGDNELYGERSDMAEASVDRLATGAWDVLSEIRTLGASKLEGPVLQIVRECVELSVCGQPFPYAKQLLSAACVEPEVEQVLARRSAGAFVTVVRNNSVRACVGSIWPQCANLVDEMVYLATQVAARDFRRAPIEPWELATCEYAVSIVGRLERVSPHEEWSPKAYGVFVRAGQRSGVILPGEALTHAKQVSWARDEAGIGPSERCEVYRFQTVKFGCSLDLRRGR